MIVHFRAKAPKLAWWLPRTYYSILSAATSKIFSFSKMADIFQNLNIWNRGQLWNLTKWPIWTLERPFLTLFGVLKTMPLMKNVSLNQKVSTIQNERPFLLLHVFDALKMMQLCIIVSFSRKSFKISKWHQISKMTPEAKIWNLIHMFDRDGFNNIFDIQCSGNNEVLFYKSIGQKSFKNSKCLTD